MDTSFIDHLAATKNNPEFTGSISLGRKSGTTIGLYSSAIGGNTTASRVSSHAEGNETSAEANYSHAEGNQTTVSGTSGHAEGELTVAIGTASHAEGSGCVAVAVGSHAEGTNCVALAGHAVGRYNIPGAGATAMWTSGVTYPIGAVVKNDGHLYLCLRKHHSGQYTGSFNMQEYGDDGTTLYTVWEDLGAIVNTEYAEVVGNGTPVARSNARTLDWSGNEWLAGKLTVSTAPTNDMDAATKKYVDDAVESVDPAGCQEAAAAANAAAAAANTAATEASRVNANVTKSGHTVSITTTNKSNVTTTKTIVEPTITVTQGSGDYDLSVTTSDGTQTVTIPNPNKELSDRAHVETVSRSKTRSGNPIQIEDAVNEIADKTVIKLVPKQDLHGYSRPWVGGAGKNLLKYPYHNTTVTRNGITFTDKGDGSITLNGTSTETTTDFTIVSITNGLPLANGDYILTGILESGTVDSTSTSSIYLHAKGDVSESGYTNFQPDVGAGRERTITIINGSMYNFTLRVGISGVTFTDYKVKLMLRSASNTDASYEPYQNICSITGYDTVNVARTGKNLLELPKYSELNGLKFIREDDGTLSISGTSTGAVTQYLYSSANNGVLYGNYVITIEGAISMGSGSGGIYASDADKTRYFSQIKADKVQDANNGINNVWFYAASNTTVSASHLKVSITRKTEDFVPGKFASYPISVSLAEDANHNPAGTVYSGTVTVNADGSGQVTIDKKKRVFTGSDVADRTSENTFRLADLSDAVAPSSRGINSEGVCSLYVVPTDVNASEFRAIDGAITYSHSNISSTTGRVAVHDVRYDTVEDYAAFLNAMNTAGTPLELVYKLATPVTYTLTANQVQTLLGYNYIYTDGAEIALTYRQQSLASNETLLKLLPTGTATGNPVTFSDGADSVPLKQLVVNVQPNQDLHGYSRPWVGGAGKNLLDPTNAAEIDGGVTWTMHDNGTIDAGANSMTSVRAYRINVTLDPGDYYFSGGIDSTHYVYVFDATTNARAVKWDGTTTGDAQYGANPAQVKIISGHTYRINSCVAANATGNVVFKPMICKSTETDFTFTPYKNICPIRGWDSVPLLRTGKNLISHRYSGYYSDASGVVVTGSQYSLFVAKVKANMTYTWSGNTDISGGGVVAFYKDFPVLGSVSYDGTRIVNAAQTTTTVESPIDGYITIRGASTDSNVQLEQGSSATAFESFNGKTYDISIPSEAGTVYGGTITLDENGEGELIVTYKSVRVGDLPWALNSNTNVFYCMEAGHKKGYDGIISSHYKTVSTGHATMNDKEIAGVSDSNAINLKDTSYSTVASMANNDAQIVYELATPVTYSLTADQVKTLLGTNIISSDAGTCEVTYFADIGKLIESKIARAIELMA